MEFCSPAPQNLKQCLEQTLFPLQHDPVHIVGFPSLHWQVKNLPANIVIPGLIPGSGRSPGEGNDNPLQYLCLGNPMDRGAWQATALGVAKESDTT